MKVYKLFIKSNNSDKFTYLTDFNEFEFDTIKSLLNCMYLGSKILIEVKTV